MSYREAVGRNRPAIGPMQRQVAVLRSFNMLNVRIGGDGVEWSELNCGEMSNEQ